MKGIMEHLTTRTCSSSNRPDTCMAVGTRGRCRAEKEETGQPANADMKCKRSASFENIQRENSKA
jgi:hypothetical protein